MVAKILSSNDLNAGSSNSILMKINHWIPWIIIILLFGCGNMPTASSKITVPHVSSTKYEHLDCFSLRKEIDRLNLSAQEFHKAQENRIVASQKHALFYGWGRGDGMDTIELVKILGERDAILRIYEKKDCTNR